MITVNRPTTVKIDQMVYNLRPGKEVPGAVVSFWKASKTFTGLKESGILIEDPEIPKGKKSVNENVVRESKGGQSADSE